ncbi:hypothetical protein PsorP6_016648 [Peronosclerospora sorghi]|uniref:Uncharacterized protein n=1 Tax=Peronosclerospora sorghi TaxID=230839 RepID=A0ACC0VMF8_9STRA|nr:hypothetical protein PsorP6_016648 [Peronosclerospora sorghi]
MAEGADVDPQELDGIRPDTDTKRVHYSFLVPPFNSIDHVHMHAFLDDPRSLGYYRRLKYRTYDQAVAKLDHLPVHEHQHEPTYHVEDSTNTFTEEGLLVHLNVLETPLTCFWNVPPREDNGQEVTRHDETSTVTEQGHTTRNGVSKERDELRQSHMNNRFPNHDKNYRSETLLDGKEFTQEDHWNDSKTHLMPRIGEKNRGPPELHRNASVSPVPFEIETNRDAHAIATAYAPHFNPTSRPFVSTR